jgi:hypothetical protein
LNILEFFRIFKILKLNSIFFPDKYYLIKTILFILKKNIEILKYKIFINFF